MAKKKASKPEVEQETQVLDAPGSLGDEPQTDEPQTEVAELPVEAENTELDPFLVSIVAPLGGREGRTPMGVHVRLKDGRLKVLMRRLLNGLNARDARLRNGQHIGTFSHVIQYLLEGIEYGHDGHGSSNPEQAS